jgi:hypothetical protein
VGLVYLDGPGAALPQMLWIDGFGLLLGGMLLGGMRRSRWGFLR